MFSKSRLVFVISNIQLSLYNNYDICLTENETQDCSKEKSHIDGTING
jgi:hypothetical protein